MINILEQDGIRVEVFGQFLIINGIRYFLPNKCKGHSVALINKRIFIDGYEFINGKFKRTLRALYHKYF